MSTPYIIILVTYNTYIAYIKANLIDLSDLVIFSKYRMITRDQKLSQEFTILNYKYHVSSVKIDFEGC